MRKNDLVCLLAAIVTLTSSSYAQLDARWIGDWKGMMQIYRLGKTVDSVSVTMTIKPSARQGSYIWRTEYHSAKQPMIKDYTLRTIDAAKGMYVTDEGEGVELTTYLVGNKMYNVFEVQNTMLTATYDLIGNELIFEVTSGKKEPPTGGGVTNYSVNNLQRVVLKRADPSK
ncbi:MAG: hypothetical protein NTU47_10615 [Ignavibacteriales bacterium]|nr:hypothetical protein [Ignavibacteriales bacterium]